MIQDMYKLLEFQGYATRNLDEAAALYERKTTKKPKAFVVRTPYRVSGSLENKKLLVASPKYGGSGAVYIPTILDKPGLEKLFNNLGEVSNKVYVERRRTERAAIDREIVKHQKRSQYERHCNYCGTTYITLVVKPIYHCSKSNCRMKHKEYLQELARRRREELSKIKEMTIGKEAKKKPEPKMPEFSMESPSNRSLQGWVYFIEAANGYVKIGRSDDPSRRFQDIVNMSPVPIWLRHTVFSDNFVVAEQTAHERFEVFRRHGEWFELPPDLLEACLRLDNYDLDQD